MTAYPYVRLRLECGCHEVQTAPGCTDGYVCEAHQTDSPLNGERMQGLERLITLAVAAERERNAMIAELAYDRMRLLGREIANGTPDAYAGYSQAGDDIANRIRLGEGFESNHGVPAASSPKNAAEG